MKKSLDFSKTINNAILFDFVHKGLLFIGMLLLMWFYKSEPIVLVIIAGLSVIAGYQVYREFVIRNELLKIEDYAREISTVLMEKLDFYKLHFPSLKWMLSFSNALLVWVGSMFYYYSKYGYYKIEDAADVVVTILMVSLAFGISYLAHTFQLKHNVLELEEALKTLDDQEEATKAIARQEIRKRRFRIAMIVIAAIGILLFIFFVINNINQ